MEQGEMFSDLALEQQYDNMVKELFFAKKTYVGGYRIGKLDHGYVQFNLLYKPNWFHRQMMKLCLGWYWYDVK